MISLYWNCVALTAVKIQWVGSWGWWLFSLFTDVNYRAFWKQVLLNAFIHSTGVIRCWLNVTLTRQLCVTKLIFYLHRQGSTIFKSSLASVILVITGQKSNNKLSGCLEIWILGRWPKKKKKENSINYNSSIQYDHHKHFECHWVIEMPKYHTSFICVYIHIYIYTYIYIYMYVCKYILCIYCMHITVLSACMSVYHVYTWHSKRPEKGIRPLRL